MMNFTSKTIVIILGIFVATVALGNTNDWQKEYNRIESNMNSGTYVRILSDIQVLIESAKYEFGTNSTQLATASLLLADFLTINKKYEESNKTLAASENFFRNLRNADKKVINAYIVSIKTRIGSNYYKMKKESESDKYLNDAIIYAIKNNVDPVYLIHAYVWLSDLRKEYKKYGEALLYINRAIKIAEVQNVNNALLMSCYIRVADIMALNNQIVKMCTYISKYESVRKGSNLPKDDEAKYRRLKKMCN